MRTLSVLYAHALEINLTLNTQKTVSMVFSPRNRHRVVANEFPVFVVGGSPIKFVNRFKYLGHIVTESLSDDDDVLREVKNLFVRTNTLLQKFHKCSVSVKIVLFKSFCLGFYDVALGSHIGYMQSWIITSVSFLLQ